MLLLEKNAVNRSLTWTRHDFARTNLKFFTPVSAILVDDLKQSSIGLYYQVKMSDTDDSETAEWEREQMLRGAQSRRQKLQQSQRAAPSIIDASIARDHVRQDLEKAEATIEANKRQIGATRIAIMRSEKKIETLRKHIKELEMNNSLFLDLAKQMSSEDVLQFIERNQPVIAKLPSDQKELMDELKRDLELAEVVES